MGSTSIGVKHVVALKTYLIFLSALDSTKCSYTLERCHLKVIEVALVIIKEIKHNGLYEIQLETVRDSIVETSNASI